jgi:hypothetical protein
VKCRLSRFYFYALILSIYVYLLVNNREMYVYRHIEARSCNHCCSERWYVLRVVCDFRFSYLACNAHAPYCHLWPARLCSIFPHFLLNGRIFEKCFGHKIRVWLFSVTFVWNISHSKKNWAGSDKKLRIDFYVKCQLFLSDINETWFYRQIFRK